MNFQTIDQCAVVVGGDDDGDDNLVQIENEGGIDWSLLPPFKDQK